MMALRPPVLTGLHQSLTNTITSHISHHTLISSLIKHTIGCNTMTLDLSNLDMQIAIFIIIIVRTGRAQWRGLDTVTLLHSDYHLLLSMWGGTWIMRLINHLWLGIDKPSEQHGRDRAQPCVIIQYQFYQSPLGLWPDYQGLQRAPWVDKYSSESNVGGENILC